MIISACLLGVRCRFDGESRPHKGILSCIDNEVLIPICPEQLGGLPTPRSPAQIEGGSGDDVLSKKARVINAAGTDVTSKFLAGAENALFIARTLGVDKAILKEKSPSCGVHYIKRNEEIIEGTGVTSALLKKHGITVISSERIFKEYV